MIEEAANDARVQVASQPDSLGDKKGKLEEDHRVAGEPERHRSELEITILVLSRHGFYDFVKSRHWNV